MGLDERFNRDGRSVSIGSLVRCPRFARAMKRYRRWLHVIVFSAWARWMRADIETFQIFLS